MNDIQPNQTLCCCCNSLSNLPKRPVPQNERVQKAIHVLQLGRLSLFSALLKVLDPMEEDFSVHRDRIYACPKERPYGKLTQLLDCLYKDPRGKAQLDAWMEPRALQHVTRKVYDEMDDVKHALAGTIDTISCDFLLNWDINTTIGQIIREHAPVLGRILGSAAQSNRAIRENKTKDVSTTCHVVLVQLAKARSNHILYFAAPFTLFLWTNGASRQVIEALAKCGLCISFTSLLKLLSNLASRCMDQAVQVARQPHIICYDNINISTSIFVEQRADASSKVQSGTFPILCELQDVNPEHVRLGPILQHANLVTGLTFNGDVRPTSDQTCALYGQLTVHVVDILLDVCTSFKDYNHRTDGLIQHVERRKSPKGRRTKQYPLRTSTIDESSISGNIAVINDAYINQLKMTHEELSDWAIPSINDQSTNARIRGAKALRTKDVNPFTQLKCFQLGFGLFHLCMNLIWALLHIHRGSIDQPGSLSYFFALLDRSRLGCEHPDYHTLLATLMQILDGIVLNAWTIECGHPSLSVFAASNPMPTELHDIAEKIICNHATPPHEPTKAKTREALNHLTDSGSRLDESYHTSHSTGSFGVSSLIAIVLIP